MQNKHSNREIITIHPKVSIVTPSYNQAQFIEKTIESVLDQDYPNIEYLIIDGGSTDGTVEIIQKYEHRLAYWVSEPDRGQSHAINKGFKRATGDILAWINSDDEYTPETISIVVQAFLENKNIHMVYGNCDIIDENSNLKGHLNSYQCDLEKIIQRNMIPQPSAFFKKEVIEEIGLLDETLNYAMDHDLWLKICARYKMKYLPLVLARFRHHTDSKTISQDNFFWPEIFIVLDNFLLKTPLERTSYDDAYAYMFELIVYWQKEHIDTAADCLLHINHYKLFSYEDVQHLCAFFDGKTLTSDDFKRVRINLFLLYKNFYWRYTRNQKSFNIEKNTHNWIDKRMLNAAHYLFHQGKSIESRRLLLMTLKNNLNVFCDRMTLRLVLKYLLTYRGIKFICQLKGIQLAFRR